MVGWGHPTLPDIQVPGSVGFFVPTNHGGDSGFRVGRVTVPTNHAVGCFFMAWSGWSDQDYPILVQSIVNKCLTHFRLFALPENSGLKNHKYL
jgi:hypothetical protein